MEHLSADTSNVKAQLSQRPSEAWSAAVIRALTLCALHFRAELTDADYEIYQRGLGEIQDAERIEVACIRCLRECEFMPKLKDILDRMPDPKTVNPKTDLKIVSEWDEPFSDKSIAHYIEYEGGSRHVQVRPK